MRNVAAMTALSVGLAAGFGSEPRYCQHRPRTDIEYLPHEPEPLTKRQRRRLRGKQRGGAHG